MKTYNSLMLPEGFYTKAATSFQDIVSRVHVSSAMNSSLWLCAVVSCPFGLLAFFSTGALQICSIVLMSLPVALTIFMHIFFTITDPEKLRSEDYAIKKQALDIIEEKGSSHPLLGAAVATIANPQIHQLEAGESRPNLSAHSQQSLDVQSDQVK